MGISLLLHSSTSYVRIRLEIDSGANLSVDGLPRSASIVPAIDWTFPLVCRCGGDRLLIRSGLFPLGGIVPS